MSKSTRRLLFSTTVITAVASAAVALAQTAPPDTSSNELVVTGSRIKHSTFTSSSPITVIDPEHAELVGSADITQTLQQAAVANNNTQINNFFSGFIVGGGPGVNTLSLRGLGAQRTLLLVDGQRLGPAGVGGSVGPVDLNTLNFPLSQISNIEVLKDGASSIYGSDAVAGVVNVITKKRTDGADLHAYYGPSEGAGDNTYQVDGSWGKSWSRGYVNLGASWYRQTALRAGERPYLSCTSDYVFDATTGARADIIDPATGRPKCYNILDNLVIDGITGVRYRPLAGAVAGGGVKGLDLPGYQAVNLTVRNPDGSKNVAATRLSHGLEPTDDPSYYNSTAVSPDERFLVDGFFGFDLTPHAHLYGSFILTRRTSSQNQAAQFFTFLDPANAFVANTPFNSTFPEPIIPITYNNRQQVDYARAVLGVKGDLPTLGFFRNWTYDLYGQFSHSQALYTQDFIYQDRVNATVGPAPASGGGCDPTSQYVAGASMSQIEPGVACVPVDYLGAVQRGGFSPTERAFLFGRQTGITIYNHYYVEGSATGDLFNLPAGPIGAAAGFQLRREEIDDRPPEAFATQNAFNYSSGGRTKGADNIEEVFGELSLPVLKDLPLVRKLNFDVSGRYSNYKSAGSTGTYKVGLDWAVTDWLTVRATQGTGFRAPALFEQFLSPTTGFLAQSTIDPCISYVANAAPANVQKNCAAQGIPGDYQGNYGSATIETGGGPGLKPETSLSRTIGVVLTPKWRGLDLKIAVDYYTFDIKNQIQNFGAANILFQCYNAPTFPNSSFCSLFHRDLTPGSNTLNMITSVSDNYVNVARQLDQGLDVTLRYRANLPWDTKFTLDSDLAWTFYTTTVLLNGQVNNFLSQVGQPTFVGNANFKFERGPWTFNYYLDMIGHSGDVRFLNGTNVINNYRGTGETVTGNYVAPFYTTSTISVRRKFKQDLAVEFGVKNVFDKWPTAYSELGFQSRTGTTPLASQYDLAGRSFFLDIDKKF